MLCWWEKLLLKYRLAVWFAYSVLKKSFWSYNFFLKFFFFFLVLDLLSKTEKISKAPQLMPEVAVWGVFHSWWDAQSRWCEKWSLCLCVWPCPARSWGVQSPCPPAWAGQEPFHGSWGRCRVSSHLAALAMVSSLFPLRLPPGEGMLQQLCTRELWQCALHSYSACWGLRGCVPALV